MTEEQLVKFQAIMEDEENRFLQAVQQEQVLTEEQLKLGYRTMIRRTEIMNDDLIETCDEDYITEDWLQDFGRQIEKVQMIRKHYFESVDKAAENGLNVEEFKKYDYNMFDEFK